MTLMDDERLMAYADGELSDDECREVEAYLERNPQAQRFVADMLRSADLLRQAFERPAQELPPQHLVEQIMASAADVVPLPSRRKRVLQRWAPLALAASIALMGLLLVNGIPNTVDTGADAFSFVIGPVARGSEISTALERLASGESVSIGGPSLDAQAVPMLTFLDRRQRPCRELEVSQSSGTILDLIIACRESAEQWNIEGVFALAGSSQVLSDDGYQPASGARDGRVDELLNGIGAGEPVAPSEERRLIDNKWK